MLPHQVHSSVKHAGIKYYGFHWGPPKTPFREDDARHLPPNYYYPAEDYLIERVSSGAAWTWCATVEPKNSTMRTYSCTEPSRCQNMCCLVHDASVKLHRL